MNDHVVAAFAVYGGVSLFAGVIVGLLWRKQELRYYQLQINRVRGERDHWREQCSLAERDEADWWKGDEHEAS